MPASNILDCKISDELHPFLFHDKQTETGGVTLIQTNFQIIQGLYSWFNAMNLRPYSLFY